MGTIALLERILGILSSLLGLTPLLELLGFGLDKAAHERTEYSIEDYAGEILQALQSPTTGLSALHTDIAGVQSAIISALDGLNVIATIPTQPDWYTPPGSSPDEYTIADAVWGKGSSLTPADAGSPSLMMSELMEGAFAYAGYNSIHVGVPIDTNPAFSYVSEYPPALFWPDMIWWQGPTPYVPPPPDWSAVLATDTVLSFLQRTQPLVDWTGTGPTGNTGTGAAWLLWYDFAPYRFWVRSNFTELQMFALASLAAAPSTPVLIAPVWPGLAGATVGSSTALSDGMTVDGPLHGLVLSITAHPAGAGRYRFGAIDSWVHCGAVIFASDRGDYELPIPIGLESFVVCPRTMAVAASAIVRLGAGFAGTVRPWSLT